MKARTIVGVVILAASYKMLGHYTDWGMEFKVVILCAVGALVLTVSGLGDK